MEEQPKQKPTKEFLEKQITECDVQIHRMDAVKRYCMFMIENEIYVEPEEEKKDGTN